MFFRLSSLHLYVQSTYTVHCINSNFLSVQMETENSLGIPENANVFLFRIDGTEAARASLFVDRVCVVL